MRNLTRRLLMLGVVTAATLGAVVPGVAAHADTQDFSYDSWRVEYEIDTDDEGRATARVIEHIVARFPDFDQNRGIVRGLPISYEGSSTDPRDFTVTDGDGMPVPFEIESDDGFVAVLVGDDDYVHGVQSYVIGYRLSDVILARDDAEADEFYWDVMDFEHAQSVAEFSGSLTFSPGLSARLNSASRCYTGIAHSTGECSLTRTEGERSVFEIEPLPLAPREGVTVAIGLQPGSVVQPPERLPSFALDTLPLLLGGAGLITSTTGAFAIRSMRRKRRIARGVIVAQYEVPPQLPPLIAAPVLERQPRAVPAQFVHLAVNGAMRVEDGEVGTGLFGTGRPQPAFRLLDASRPGDPLDSLTLEEIFGVEAEPGETFSLPKNDQSFALRMRKLALEGEKQARDRGYLEKVRNPVARVLGFVSLGLGAIVLLLSIIGLATRDTPFPAIGIVGCIAILILSATSLKKHEVHTPLGAETREYLEGVREFIRVAEADRLQMLQSYSGARRFKVGAAQVVQIYEKLLPYAMLFGLEKEWAGVLEVKYREQGGYAPLWLPVAAMQGAGGMSSTISQFTSSMTSSVSYTSSSSGGSGGGGFSGGGGGGGFSGGR